MSYAVYLLFRGFSFLLCLLSLPAVFRLGRVVGRLVHFSLPGYRRLTRANLRIAFPEKSAAELRALTREHFATLGANLLSSVKIFSMPLAEIERHATTEGAEHLSTATAGRRSFIGVLSHMGNWELLAQLGTRLFGVASGTIYQRLGNAHLDAYMRAGRSRLGLRTFERQEGLAAATQLLREGGVLGVLSDQHAGDKGVWCPFFDRLASTSPLPATLALRTGAALIPITIYTAGVARWRIVVSPPIEPAPGDVALTTARMNQAIEAQIRQSPADWFWVHNRWKTPSPKFLLASYKRGLALPDGFYPARLQPFRILIRSSNWLGDAVMTVPAVQAIRRGRPDARVTILTRDKLADFWKSVPGVDAVISIESGDGLFAVAKKVRGQFDVAILFPNSIRTALEVWLAGIPRRVGYPGRWRRRLLNQIVRLKNTKPGPPRHQAWHYLDLAKFVGAEIERGTACDAPARAPAEGRPLLGLCPGAEYGGAKRWPVGRFAEAARVIAERRDCEWVLLGTARDRPITDEIAATLGDRARNLAGETTLPELMTELSRCRLLLTNDTGTMHLAAHLGVPAIAIFGSTEPALTGPLGAGHRVIRHQVECSPCFLRECPIDFRCMEAVTVDEVVEAVIRAL